MRLQASVRTNSGTTSGTAENLTLPPEAGKFLNGSAWFVVEVCSFSFCFQSMLFRSNTSNKAVKVPCQRHVIVFLCFCDERLFHKLSVMVNPLDTSEIMCLACLEAIIHSSLDYWSEENSLCCHERVQSHMIG